MLEWSGVEWMDGVDTPNLGPKTVMTIIAPAVLNVQSYQSLLGGKTFLQDDYTCPQLDDI